MKPLTDVAVILEISLQVRVWHSRSVDPGVSAKGRRGLKISPLEKASSSFVSSFSASKRLRSVCFRFEAPRLFTSCRGVVVPVVPVPVPTRERDVSIFDGIFVRCPPMSERARVGIPGGWSRLQVEATDLQVFYALPSWRGQCVIYGAFSFVLD